MRIHVSWLRELVDVPVSVRELADTLQSCGFEVALVEPLPPAPDGTEDGVIDLEVTTNRPDCLNVQGIAREVGAKFERDLRDPSLLPLEPRDGARLPLRVVIEDNERCPRYAAAMADVALGSSPRWVAARLEAAGVRPISNIVDITNYVMLELGQPLHAFDYARLGGQEIRVRRARPDEKLQTLDGTTRTLDPEMLVIADVDRAQAVAGLMGGAASEVSGATTVVVFESACFQASSVRRTARRLGMSSEASYRFERGSNVQMPVRALERVARLLETTGAGRMRSGVLDVYPVPRLPLRVLLRHDRIARLLGFSVEGAEIERVLRRLGFQLERLDDPALTWQAIVPFWRVDVAREADLIEEVARHVGYDRLPTAFPPLVKAPARPDARLERERVVRRVALSSGFSESLTFTFIERAAALRYAEPGALVALANPLSETYSVMRPLLLPGLVDSLAHNRRRERHDVRLFELGARLQTTTGETRAIALAATGWTAPEHWSESSAPVTFFDMKGTVETILAAVGVQPMFAPVSHPALVGGRSASVLVEVPGLDPIVVGMIGQLVPAVAEAQGVPRQDEVYVAEIDIDAIGPLVNLGEDLRVRPLARFPSIVRDLSVLVSATTPAASIRHTIREAAPPTLERAFEFARYGGKGIPEGQVSLSFRLVFRAPDRTMTDTEVQEATTAIVAALDTAHGARLR